MNVINDLRRVHDQAMRGGEEKRRRKNRRDRRRDRALAAAPIRRVKRNKRASNILENRKKQFRRLGDPKYDRQLRSEYIPYSAQAYAYYSIVGGITAYLRAHLNDRVVAGSTQGRPENAIVSGGKERERPYLDYYKAKVKEAASGGRHLKIKGDDVQVNLSPVTFNVVARITEDSAPVLQQKLKALFGDFTMPTRYQRNDENGRLEVISGDYSTGLKPLSFYQKLRFTKDEFPGYYQPDQLELDRSFPKDLINLTTVEVKLHSAAMDDYRVPSGQAAGAISTYAINLTFRVMGVVTFPLEYALWATNASDLTDFVPKVFREHFDTLGLIAVGATKAKYQELFARTMHIGTVKKINEQRVKDFDITVRPRTNKDNFTILMDGSIYYVPPVDNADAYVEILRKSYDADQGLIVRNSELPEIRNLPLLTDWINDAFAYTDSSGKPSSKRLIGSVPLDDITILRNISAELNTYDSGLLNTIRSIGDKVCAALNLYDISNDANLNMARSYSGLFVYLQRTYGNVTYRSLVKEAMEDTTDGHIFNPRDRRLILEFVRLNLAIAKNLMASKEYSISIKCEFIYNFYVLGSYAQQSQQYYESYLKALETNRPVPEENIPTSFKIPNLPGIKTVLPHQGQLLAQSAKAPKLLVEEVDAGGGKTFMSLADMIILLEKKAIKRPLVICPGGLVKEWTSEVNRASQGRINIVPINADVIQRMVKHLNYTRHQYIQYMKSAPINTIFVCSLNFLRSAKDYFTGESLGNLLQFGENYIRFFPAVQLIRQLNPDYIVLDESHYAKNAKALRTEAMYSLSPVSEFRRVASGTMMQNDPTDNVAQYGLLNPAIFGTREAFLEKYGVESNGKFIELLSGAENEMARVRAPYVVRVKKSRRDWSHLLPTIRNNVITVEPTEAQREFYQVILKKELDQIRNDPKIKKLLEKADEKGLAQLEKQLDKRLSVVEQFINAPDANPAYVNWSERKLSRRDLVSSKVRAINTLVAQHINGHIDSQTGNQVAPDPNKIIIFCYNKVVSRHVWRHLDRQDIAIHYAISGSQPRNDAPSGAAKMSANEALLRFRQDPKIKILVADETSLREGLNLQVASRVIRVQTLFAPGAQEQAMSRALRPDVDNLYNRDYINVNWLICNFSFEVGKAARLISKMVTNFKVGEAENPKWIQFTRNTPIPSLELIKLNLDKLEAYTTPEHPEVSDYFDSYRVINDWEEVQFTETKQHYRQLFGKLLGKDPKDVNLRKDARFKLDGSGVLPGTKSIFVPLAAGATPIDNRGLNLKALAVLATKDADEEDNDNDYDEDDEEEGEEEDVVTFEEGDLVQTEYGFGYIRAAQEGGVAILKKGVRVVIPGFNDGYPIAFSRLSVFKPVPPSADEDSAEYKAWMRNVRQLKADMKKAGKKGITFVQGYIGPVTTMQTPVTVEDVSTQRPPKNLPPHPAARPPKIKVIRDDEDENDEEDNNSRTRRTKKTLEHLPKTPKQSDKKSPKYDIEAAVINGIPALVIYTDEEGTHQEELKDHGTWWTVPTFMNARVRTYQGALNLVDTIKRVFPSTSDNLLNGILGVAKKMRGSTSNELIIRRSAVQHRDILNFMKLDHLLAPSTSVLKIYPFIYNDEMFVGVAIPNQPRQAAKLRTLNIRGVSKFEKTDPMAWHFGKDVSTLKRYLKKMVDSGLKINGYNDALAKLNDPFLHKLTGYEPLR